MKKLLFQFDTDPHPSSFDTVVAYDGGADQVVPHGSVTPDSVRALVEGTIFTRAPRDKKNTAIFIGGSQLAAGQQLLAAVQSCFFADFRVSVMLDSNGANTTAAAAVARLGQSGTLQGRKAVILAGTGPVGQRAAVMLARAGAEVSLTSRRLDQARAACQAVETRFGVSVTPVEAADHQARAAAIAQAHVVFSTGAAGVPLLEPQHWMDHPCLELMADANATPPLGIGGIDVMDRGTERHGRIVWGAIGFGTLKLALHRACIARLFESNRQVLDAAEIYELAKTLA